MRHRNRSQNETRVPNLHMLRCSARTHAVSIVPVGWGFESCRAHRRVALLCTDSCRLDCPGRLDQVDATMEAFTFSTTSAGSSSIP